MSSKVIISVIVAIYKNIDFLELILQSVQKQSFGDFELIIAEDDSYKEVSTYIKKNINRFTYPIKHVSQPDKGFRKNKILNKAVHISSGEYLVFIDGDCILHKHFLREHIKRAKPGLCLFGRRVMLDQKITEQLTETKNLKLLNLFRIFFFSKSRKKEEAIYLPFSISNRSTGVLGCNFCVSKENIIKINGFDEDFESPFFGEDTDVFRRLTLIGIKMKCTKFNTIQYHLYHDSSGRDNEWAVSETLYNNKVKKDLWYCRNGLEKK